MRKIIAPPVRKPVSGIQDISCETSELREQANHPAGDHGGVFVVENQVLAGGGSENGRFESHIETAPPATDDCAGFRFADRSYFAEKAVAGIEAAGLQTIKRFSGHRAHKSRRARPDDDGVRIRPNLKNIQRLGMGDAEAASLADGVMVQAGVLAQHMPFQINNRAGSGGRFSEQGPVIALVGKA